VEICGILFIYLYVIRRLVDVLVYAFSSFLPSKSPRSYGEWCVITGVTSGIGRSYAFAMAKRGLNIVLISRAPDKLSDLASELQKRFPAVSTRSLPIDFQHFDVAARFQVKATIEKLNVGILINNVGESYEHPKYFHELTEGEVQSLIDLNVSSTAHMSHIVINKMIQQGNSKGRTKGEIVNISSFAALVDGGLLAEYSAAKCFIDKLTASLNLEYKHKGIHIQTQHALFVTTKLAKIRKSTLFIPTPDRYVHSAMKCLGRGDSVYPYWAHALQSEVFLALPSFVQHWYTLKQHFSLRARALKKKAENKTE